MKFKDFTKLARFFLWAWLNEECIFVYGFVLAVEIWRIIIFGSWFKRKSLTKKYKPLRTRDPRAVKIVVDA